MIVSGLHLQKKVIIIILIAAVVLCLSVSLSHLLLSAAFKLEHLDLSLGLFLFRRFLGVFLSLTGLLELEVLESGALTAPSCCYKGVGEV